MKGLKDILFWSFIIFCVINVINTLRNLIYAYTLKIPKWEGGNDILNKKNKIYKREAIKSLYLFILLLIL